MSNAQTSQSQMSYAQMPGHLTFVFHQVHKCQRDTGWSRGTHKTCSLVCHLCLDFHLRFNTNKGKLKTELKLITYTVEFLCNVKDYQRLKNGVESLAKKSRVKTIFLNVFRSASPRPLTILKCGWVPTRRSPTTLSTSQTRCRRRSTMKRSGILSRAALKGKTDKK